MYYDDFIGRISAMFHMFPEYVAVEQGLGNLNF